jgi:predicted sugar kinase
MMQIIPGIIENDFESFTRGVSVIQRNMSKVFYGKSSLYASNNVAKIFNYLNINGYSGFGQSSWGPTGFVFCKDNEASINLSKDIQNFIELKKIKGINLRIVEGRNKGKIKTVRIIND